MIPYKRRRLSRFQLDAQRERDEAIQAKAEMEASLANDEKELIEAAKKKSLLMRREPGKSSQATSQVTSNRKKPGTKTKRAEISASTKVRYCEEMLEDKARFTRLGDFWKAQSEKFGLSKRQLSHMLSQYDTYKRLSAQPKLLTSRRFQRSTRKRASGAGRKFAFPDIISGMKTWLSLERACGHTISKQDVLAEYLGRLQLTANELRNQANAEDITALRRGELLREASDREARKSSILAKDSYRKTTARRLVSWLGAKYMQTELVTSISEVESHTRTKLTWQEFDHSLWLATCASEDTLAQSNRVSSPKQFISARPQLVIGFSDQVPLWAKATGRRAVFAQEEIHASDDVKDYSSVRQAIQEVMHSAGGPDMLLGQLAPFTPQPQRKLSFEPSPKDKVVRKLSFESASQPEQASPCKNLFESPEASQSEEGHAPEDVVQIVPASPEQEAAATTEQKAAASSKQEEASQPTAPSAKPALPQPGSTTIIGISGEDRYRITYEARQILHSVYADEDQEIIGSVGKGLLVVPGQWARLDNISNNGTWLKTETFQVGETVITRTKGTSAGRVLLPYRRLRESHPELMSKIELMQQPAANVDSVILTWSIEAQAQQYPASLWQRDCFSSVFSDTAIESMALANQLSCLVAEKCTSKLQITDTDFSKQFKSYVRNKLIELRAQWQTERKEEHSVWKVGPLQLVTAVVHAQEKMSEKNLRDNWVLRAAVRNGILVYRPDPASGQLVELLSQPWAESMGLEIGTKRYNPEWLRDRLKWKDDSGVPKEADWNLSKTAKNISDLQVWDYWHPEDDKDLPEDQQMPEIEDAIADDLELELQNSLSLRISPALRRAQLRRMGTPEYEAKQKTALSKRLKARIAKKWLRKHRKKVVAQMVEKVQSQSREEALSEVVPQVKQKQGKQKLSTVFKHSLKNKACAKNKPSAKVKALKKKAKKAGEQKALGNAEAKKHAQKEATEAPPLPPPADSPLDAVADHDDLFLQKEAIVTSEEAGKMTFGKEGKLTCKNPDTGFYSMLTTSGVYPVRPEWLALKSSKPHVKRVEWPKWTQLSKADLRLWLSQLSCNPQDQVGIKPEDWNTHTVLPCSQDIPEAEDQHIWLGWCLINWCFRKAFLSQPDEIGVNCVDPILSKLIFEFEGEPEELEMLKQGLKKSWLESTKLLLVPVYSKFHWTLLAGQREEPQKPISWRRYDSLSKEHEESHPQQIYMGELLDPHFSLPPLRNIAKQPVKSNACGWYLLHYLEQEVRLFRGEWPSVWPETGWNQWHQRMVQAVPKLKAEQKMVTEVARLQYSKLEAEKACIAKEKGKAEEKLKKLKDVTTVAYITAQQHLEKNSVRFTWKNLSEAAVHKVKALEHSFPKCSKCRWSSGCLDCDPFKCLRYHLHTEAAKAKKLPFLSTGPEDLQQLLSSPTLAIQPSSAAPPISSS